MKSEEKDQQQSKAATDTGSGSAQGESRRQLMKGASLLAGLASLGAVKELSAQTIPGLPGPPAQTNDGGQFLQGQVAIVTGAARGIGQAIAFTLANAGAGIVAVDIVQNLPLLQYDLANYSDLTNTAQTIRSAGGQCLPIPADVRDDAAMKDVVQQALGAFGRIDILVANAGVQIYNVPLAQTTEAQWRLIINVNLTGAANSMRAVLPTMIQQQAGNIIALTSVEGRMGG